MHSTMTSRPYLINLSGYSEYKAWLYRLKKKEPAVICGICHGAKHTGDCEPCQLKQMIKDFFVEKGGITIPILNQLEQYWEVYGCRCLSAHHYDMVKLKQSLRGYFDVLYEFNRNTKTSIYNDSQKNQYSQELMENSSKRRKVNSDDNCSSESTNELVVVNKITAPPSLSSSDNKYISSPYESTKGTFEKNVKSLLSFPSNLEINLDTSESDTDIMESIEEESETENKIPQKDELDEYKSIRDLILYSTINENKSIDKQESLKRTWTPKEKEISHLRVILKSMGIRNPIVVNMLSQLDFEDFNTLKDPNVPSSRKKQIINNTHIFLTTDAFFKILELESIEKIFKFYESITEESKMI